MKRFFYILLLFIGSNLLAQDLNKKIYFADKFFGEKRYVEAADLYRQVFQGSNNNGNGVNFYPYQTNLQFQINTEKVDSVALFNSLKIKWAEALLYSYQYAQLDSILRKENRPLNKRLTQLEYKLLIAQQNYQKVLDLNPSIIDKRIAEKGKVELEKLAKKTINVYRVSSQLKSIYNLTPSEKAIVLNDGYSSELHEVLIDGNNINSTETIVIGKWKQGISSFTEDTVNHIIYFASNVKGNSQLYFTQKINGAYTQPRKLNDNINKGGAIHPFYHHTTKRIYFASDRSGGKGLMDIWYCNIDKYGNADSASNYNIVNTHQDDISPYINEGGTFFYSSNSENGIGGYDVYALDSSNGTVRNLGMPINSGKEDVFYAEKNDRKWVSSNRNECDTCRGLCLDIFKFEPYSILVDVTVLNSETKEIIPEAKVQLINEVLLDSNLTNSKGEVQWSLTPKTKYNLIGKKEGYFKGYDSLVTQQSQQEFKSILYLKPIPKGEITLEGILYDLAKWSLRPESEKILDSLVITLNDNPELKIELSSHTDSRGSARYNQKLSQKRAESCVSYLIKNGINPERLVAKGYGEEKLKIKDAKTEQEHQENRRTSFSIIQSE